ncbi:uncharacterized protein LOC106999112 [Macaca mulatta]
MPLSPNLLKILKVSFGELNNFPMQSAVQEAWHQHLHLARASGCFRLLWKVKGRGRKQEGEREVLTSPSAFMACLSARRSSSGILEKKNQNCAVMAAFVCKCFLQRKPLALVVHRCRGRG